jgi:hypothetical protein
MSRSCDATGSRKRKYGEVDTFSISEAQSRGPQPKALRIQDRPVVLGKRAAASLDACTFDKPDRPGKRMCREDETGYPAHFIYPPINHVIRTAHLARLEELTHNIPARADAAQPAAMQISVFG